MHHEHPINFARVRSCQDLFAGQMAKPNCRISEWRGGGFKDLPQTQWPHIALLAYQPSRFRPLVICRCCCCSATPSATLLASATFPTSWGCCLWMLCVPAATTLATSWGPASALPTTALATSWSLASKILAFPGTTLAMSWHNVVHGSVHQWNWGRWVICQGCRWRLCCWSCRCRSLAFLLRLQSGLHRLHSSNVMCQFLLGGVNQVVWLAPMLPPHPISNFCQSIHLTPQGPCATPNSGSAWRNCRWVVT